MKIKTRLLKYFCSIILLGFATSIKSQTLTVGGTNWTVPITPITEAGNNYT